MSSSSIAVWIRSSVTGSRGRRRHGGAEVGLPLLEERLDRFLVLGCRVGLGERLDLARLHLPRVLARAVDGEERLDHAQRRRRVGGDLRRHLERARQQLIVRHHVVDEPGARDLRRRVELAGEAHLARLGEADALHDVVRARELGHQAHAHEEHAEPRLVRGEDDVERKDHGEPDADRDAVDGGDQRLRLAAERDPVATLGAPRCSPRSPRLEARLEGLFDVGAGAEPAAGAGHDHRADARDRRWRRRWRRPSRGAWSRSRR